MKTYHDTAATVLIKLRDNSGTIKSLVMNQQYTDKKLLLALVCETLKYKLVINEIIERAGLCAAEKKHSKELLMVLVYDHLFGKGIKNGPYKATILKHKTRLNAELVKIKIRRKVRTNAELIPEIIRNALVLPRYVRVNTIKTTVEKAVNHFIAQGYTLSDYDTVFKTKVYPPKTLCKDQHLSELLILPPSADLHEDEFLISGKIVLQDKASCFPAFILSPPKNSIVMDGCAAPGNKTSHLSAIMGNTGKIYAIDMDRKRLDTLEMLTGRAGCKNITAINASFLELDPMDKNNAKVEYILLDPSCSGSGIVGRMDHLLQDVASEETKEDRIQSLADFQKQVILHAFKFPSVKRIVYSTCSKYAEENEHVVKYVLSQTNTFRLVKDVFPTWQRRGEEIIKGAKHLIRTLPEEDMTIGFFVSLFERFTNPHVQ